MMEVADDGGLHPRAFLTVAGRMVARHQIELALALECRRIVCLVRTITPEVTALKARAEEAGAYFHALLDPRSLLSLASASDELIVFTDSLMAEPRAAIELLASGNVVLVQPAEAGLPSGFERLDLNRATGGIMAIPARLVERLAELPPDYDLPSALTRIALQSGVPMREIPEASRIGGRWQFVRSESEAHALDSVWIALNLGEGSGAMPSEMLARSAIHAFGSSLLHAGSSSRILSFGTAILLTMALGSGWLGAFATAFAIVSLACLLGQASIMLMRVEQGTLEPLGSIAALSAVLGWLIDAILALLVAWPAPPLQATSLIGRSFAPLVLVGILRLVPWLFERKLALWTQDRMIVAAILAVAASFGAAMKVCELMTALLIAGAVAHRSVGTGRQGRL